MCFEPAWAVLLELADWASEYPGSSESIIVTVGINDRGYLSHFVHHVLNLSLLPQPRRTRTHNKMSFSACVFLSYVALPALIVT